MLLRPLFFYKNTRSGTNVSLSRLFLKQNNVLETKNVAQAFSSIEKHALSSKRVAIAVVFKAKQRSRSKSVAHAAGSISKQTFPGMRFLIPGFIFWVPRRLLDIVCGGVGIL